MEKRYWMEYAGIGFTGFMILRFTFAAVLEAGFPGCASETFPVDICRFDLLYRNLLPDQEVHGAEVQS